MASLIKNSFSLSSLAASPVNNSSLVSTPDTGCVKRRPSVERPYNSLTKKSKRDFERDSWRNSWGSSGMDEQGKNEFWAALQSDYNYLMDMELIDSCKDAGGDVSSSRKNPVCRITSAELFQQHESLCSWINTMEQKMMDSENQNYHHDLLCDEAAEKFCPELKKWMSNCELIIKADPSIAGKFRTRISSLNFKWEQLRQLLLLPSNDDQVVPMDYSASDELLEQELCEQPNVSLQRIPVSPIDHCNNRTMFSELEKQVQCLRKWLREMESQLRPLDFQIGWTLNDLEKRASEQLVVQREIESRGQLVGSVLRLCDRLLGDSKAASVSLQSPQEKRIHYDAAHAQRVVRGLERRWHQLWLRSLEWQCLIDSLLVRARTGQPLSNCSFLGVDSDEEPLRKYPRIGGSSDYGPRKSTDDMVIMNSNCEFSDTTRRSNQAVYHFKHDSTCSDSAESLTDEVVTSTPVAEKEKIIGAEALPAARKLEFEPSPNRLQLDSIRQLADKAEQLVQSNPSDAHGTGRKAARLVSDWLKKSHQTQPNHSGWQIAYSGDASAESTDDDDVTETVPVSVSANGTGEINFGSSTTTTEDELDSVATCRHNKSVSSLVDSPKAVLRTRKRATNNKERPKSMSFESSCQQANFNQSSARSEGAIHKMEGRRKLKSRRNKRQQTVFRLESDSGSQTNPTTTATSSDDHTTLQACASSVPHANKREKTPMKSNSSGSERRQRAHDDRRVRRKQGGMVKSESFSGYSTSRVAQKKVQYSSDPTVRTHRDTTDASSSPTQTSDLEHRLKQNSKNEAQDAEPELPCSSSTGTSPMGTVSRRRYRRHDDVISGCSEQDWDNYQEKYLSEPYSEEPFDPEATQRLLSFGEDYRSYLDSSHSDAASIGVEGLSSPIQSPSPNRKRKANASTNTGVDLLLTIPLLRSSSGELLDSDSDLEDLRHILNQSRSQLNFVHTLFQTHDGSTPLGFSEISATCQENIKCLKVILNNVKSHDPAAFQECRDISTILLSWECLAAEVERSAELFRISREISQLRACFTDFQAQFDSVEIAITTEVTNLDQLHSKQAEVKQRLNELTEKKSQLQVINASAVTAHLLLAESNHQLTPKSSHMKEEISELYQLCEGNYQRGTRLLSNVQALCEMWQLFESQRIELANSFRMDRVNLTRMVNNSGSSGCSSDHDARQSEDSSPIPLFPPMNVSLVPSTYSCTGSDTSSSPDSGVSDSDFELHDRSLRLDSLKQYASHLTAVLPAQSRALGAISQCLGEAEAELEALRASYQEFMFRSSLQGSSADALGQGLVKRRTKSIPDCKVAAQKSPVPRPTTSRFSRIWKILRFALTFQAAIIGLVSLAYLLQPECCDFSNTYCMSWTPHLTYVHGMPPV